MWLVLVCVIMTEESREDKNLHFAPDEETVTDAWKGAFIYTSWGYNQTTTTFARIMEVSESGKTVIAKLVKSKQINTEKGSERVLPSAETYGDEFRLHVRNSGGDPVFRGSYPFINGDMDEGTRRDSFFPVSNTPGKDYHQTAPGYGH